MSWIWRIDVSVCAVLIIFLSPLGCQSENGSGDSASSSEKREEQASQVEDTTRMSLPDNTESEKEAKERPKTKPNRLPVQHKLLRSDKTVHSSSSQSPPVGGENPRILGVGILDRDGQNDLWSESDLQFSLFNIEPDGDFLTAIPTVENVPAITVPTGEYKSVRICSATFWDMEQIPIQNSIYKSFQPNQERPFKVVAVQPAVSYFALTDSLGDIEEASESAFFDDTVVFSADLSGDGLADIARTQFCCDDPSMNSDKEGVVCSSCSATYHRDESGSWVTTNRLPPC